MLSARSSAFVSVETKSSLKQLASDSFEVCQSNGKGIRDPDSLNRSEHAYLWEKTNQQLALRCSSIVADVQRNAGAISSWKDKGVELIQDGWNISINTVLEQSLSVSRLPPDAASEPLTAQVMKAEGQHAYFALVDLQLLDARSVSRSLEWLHTLAVIARQLYGTPKIQSIVDKTSGYNPFGQDAIQHCPICHEEIEGETIAALPCSHGFHRPCIVTWLTENDLCPCCRQPVLSNSLGSA
jgi:hypothetical protein